MSAWKLKARVLSAHPGYLGKQCPPPASLGKDGESTKPLPSHGLGVQPELSSNLGKREKYLQEGKQENRKLW